MFSPKAETLTTSFFDQNGNMYYTHFTGTVYNPDGAVYRVTPDFEHEEVFIPHLCGPNGICFSPDYSVMWITEFTAGRLLRIPMNNPGLGCVVYHFTGYLARHSCEVDADGNVYVCMFNQGRIMVFNPDGYPIGRYSCLTATWATTSTARTPPYGRVYGNATSPARTITATRAAG